mgnify:CR=1 FL=1
MKDAHAVSHKEVKEVTMATLTHDKKECQQGASGVSCQARRKDMVCCCEQTQRKQGHKKSQLSCQCPNLHSSVQPDSNRRIQVVVSSLCLKTEHTFKSSSLLSRHLNLIPSMLPPKPYPSASLWIVRKI